MIYFSGRLPETLKRQLLIEAHANPWEKIIKQVIRNPVSPGKRIITIGNEIRHIIIIKSEDDHLFCEGHYFTT